MFGKIEVMEDGDEEMMRGCRGKEGTRTQQSTKGLLYTRRESSTEVMTHQFLQYKS